MKAKPEKILRIRGDLGTDKDFVGGQDIQVTVTVKSIEVADNEDGSITRIYKAKLFEIND